MTQRSFARFADVEIVADGWGGVGPDGTFRRHDHVRDAAGDVLFEQCLIGGTIVAVFGDRKLGAEHRLRIAEARPPWVDVVVFATVGARPEPRVAAIDARIGSPRDADPAMCAFAVACATFAAGRIAVDPVRYVVSVDRRTYDVTASFDWASRKWDGEVSMNEEARHD